MKVAEIVGAIGAMLDKHELEWEPIKRMRQRMDCLRGLIARHEASLATLRKRLEKESARVSRDSPYLRSAFLQPLADAVLTQFPGMKAEILGPFGLACTSSITIFDPSQGSNDRPIRWLQFRFDNSTRTLSYVDFSHSSGDYPAGSIGAINGMNYASVDIPLEMSIVELVSKFKPCAVTELETC